MKNIALLLPLVTVLSLSACDNANNQIDTNPNAQSSQNNDTQTDDTQINNNVNTPTDEKIADNPQATDTLVNNDTLEKDTLKNDALKKDTIEFLYRDTVLSYGNNENVVDDLDTLFTYANKDLQNAIALVKADPLNTGDNYTNGMTDCNEVRYILKLDVGNGGSIN